jgi:hypothetical protein
MRKVLSGAVVVGLCALCCHVVRACLNGCDNFQHMQIAIIDEEELLLSCGEFQQMHAMKRSYTWSASGSPDTSPNPQNDSNRYRPCDEADCYETCTPMIDENIYLGPECSTQDEWGPATWVTAICTQGG